MPFPIAAVIAAGAPFVARAFGRKTPNYGRIVRKYVGMKAQGELRPEDYAQAERFRARGARSIGTLGETQRALARRAATAGRYTGSPAEQRSLGRISGIEGVANEELGSRVDDFLYNTLRGRESFEQNKILTGMGAEIGANQRQYETDQAKDAGFWNMASQYFPQLLSFFGGGGVDAGGSDIGTGLQPGWGGDPWAPTPLMSR